MQACGGEPLPVTGESARHHAIREKHPPWMNLSSVLADMNPRGYAAEQKPTIHRRPSWKRLRRLS